jgi:hypothetical protein
MASKIQAIGAYAPKIKLGKTASLEQLVQYIAGRTGLSDGEITAVLKELRDAIIFFTLQGRGAKIDGLGTYLPKVKLDGRFDVSHRLDATIRNALNSPNAFSGEIENRNNIGKTADDLAALWDEAHPDDPIS